MMEKRMKGFIYFLGIIAVLYVLAKNIIPADPGHTILQLGLAIALLVVVILFIRAQLKETRRVFVYGLLILGCLLLIAANTYQLIRFF